MLHKSLWHFCIFFKPFVLISVTLLRYHSRMTLYYITIIRNNVLYIKLYLCIIILLLYNYIFHLIIIFIYYTLYNKYVFSSVFSPHTIIIYNRYINFIFYKPFYLILMSQGYNNTKLKNYLYDIISYCKKLMLVFFNNIIYSIDEYRWLIIYKNIR